MAKVSRKELLKKDDAFLAAASQGARWLGSHRTPVIVGAVVSVLAMLAIWAVVQYQQSRDAEASMLFARGMEILEQGVVVAEGSDEQPDPDAEPPRFASEEEQWTAARDQFQEVIDEAGGGAATLAAFMVADLHEKLGDREAAEARFLELVDSLSPRDSLYFVAVERAAYLQEARGDVEGALRSLARLANVDNGFYEDYATFHQARLYLAKGETERARNLLTRIEQEHPTSALVERVREQLAALGPQPGATGGDEAAAPAAPEAQAAEGASPAQQQTAAPATQESP